MSKADEMFEKLDYIVEEAKFNVYIGKGNLNENFVNCFVIHKNSKSISIFKNLISKGELQAINQK